MKKENKVYICYVCKKELTECEIKMGKAQYLGKNQYRHSGCNPLSIGRKK